MANVSSEAATGAVGASSAPTAAANGAAATKSDTKEEEIVHHPDADQTPILTLPGDIVIRAYNDADIPFAAKHGNNRKIAARMTNRYPDPYTREAAERWVNSTKDPATFARSGAFDPATDAGVGPAIPTKYCIVVGGDPCGGIGFQLFTDVLCRSANLGYWLSEEYWGRGIMGTVAPAFVKWILDTFGVVLRLEGGVYQDNPASCKVLQKAGFKFLHRKEKAIWKWGQVLAIDEFELVRED